MNPAKASELLGRLCAAWGRTIEDDRAKLYMDFLCDLDEAIGIGAVERAINKEHFFPSIGELRTHVEAISPSREGIPGAAAYGKQKKRVFTAEERAAFARAIALEDAMIAMDDADYMTMLTEMMERQRAERSDA
ncbi:MAG: hypothetical protein GX998_12555 [Firmicutes bacterium]|jgi:hypothetical protein|nr:hypothetical protein [Bacillota bacterium]